MSKTGPSRELVESMGREPLNVLSSILCLSAAISVKRGEKGPISIEVCEASGIPIDDKTRAFLIDVAHKAVKLFAGNTAAELEAAIELFGAHLEWCGYSAEWGTTH